MILVNLVKAILNNWPISLTLLLGAAGIYLLLPRPRRYSRLAGAACATAALVLAGTLLVRVRGFNAESLLFYGFSAIALVSGALLITVTNPARAALAFTLVVLATCGLFLLLAAPFLMAATIIIYAGAIIVTFLFVLMLAQQEGRSDADQRSREPLLSVIAGFLLLGALLYVLDKTYGTEELDRLLDKAGQAAQKPTAKEMDDALGSDFFKDLGTVLMTVDRSPDRTLRGDAENVQASRWETARAANDVEGMRDALAEVQDIGRRARAVVGFFQPSGDTPLSAYSGPPANLSLYPAVQGEADSRTPAIRRNAAGVPELPAENVGYLGRSLFTDYLLPVELGGTLLLVATIGAIAITGRRPGRPT
jgi:NADH-quinone oxidoreductase subunit J